MAAESAAQSEAAGGTGDGQWLAEEQTVAYGWAYGSVGPEQNDSAAGEFFSEGASRLLEGSVEEPYRPGFAPEVAAAFDQLGPSDETTTAMVTPTVPMPSFRGDGQVAEYGRRLDAPPDLQAMLVAGIGLSLVPGRWW